MHAWPLLADLRRLHRLAAGVSLDWELLAQGAQATRDECLLDITQRCHPQALRQMRWANAMLKELSPQALDYLTCPHRLFENPVTRRCPDPPLGAVPRGRLDRDERGSTSPMVARKRTEDVRVHSDVAQLLGEQPVQQRREWVVDRVGWIVMALVLTAALAGLWGSGPLSNAEATSADGRLSISYDRFVRNHGSTVIQVRVGPDVAEDRVVGVGIDSDYLLRNQVRAITPNPSSVTSLGGYDVYAFQVGPGAPLTVRFDLRPDPDTWAAAHTAQFRIAGSPPMQIRQYVYP